MLLINLLQPLLISDILDLCLSCINLTDKEISKQFYALIHKISLINILQKLSIFSLVSITPKVFKTFIYSKTSLRCFRRINRKTL